MEEKQVVPAGSFCWNEGCADYGQVGKGNIIKNGKTDTGVQRSRCQTCTNTFTETKGTLFYPRVAQRVLTHQESGLKAFFLTLLLPEGRGISDPLLIKSASIERACEAPLAESVARCASRGFYRCRHSQEAIVECLAMRGDRTSLAALHRIKGAKEETVGQWLEKAAAHVHQVEEHLVRAHKLKRVQLDALWTYVGHKGEKGAERKKKQEERIARGTAIDLDTRLRVGRALAKTKEEVAPQLMLQVKQHITDREATRHGNGWERGLS